MKSVWNRFWDKVDKTGDCWLWTASKTSAGYGNFKAAANNVYAHRLSYEWLMGPIPEGLVIDHLCRVPNCVNPEHLEPVTHKENVRRGTAGWNIRARTHCAHGHEFSAENTRRYKLKSGGWERKCLTCSRKSARETARKRRERNKQENI